MPDKPPHGAPCNGCGLCCMDQICPFGEIVLRRTAAPCPALERDGERYVCGLVRHPRAYAPVTAALHSEEALRRAAMALVGAGLGCDAQLEGEPADEAFRARLRRESRTLTGWRLAELIEPWVR